MRPISMRAMRIHGANGRLHLEQVPIRRLRSHEILIKVSACFVGVADFLARADWTGPVAQVTQVMQGR